MEETMGIQPTYNLASHDNDDCNMGSWWFWIILIFLFCGNGFGNNNNAIQDELMSSEFIKRDLFNMNQNVSNTSSQTQRDVLESRYTTELGLKDNQYTAQSCCCETNRNIDAVRADSYKNTCDITTAIHDEAEATRALINANTMQELRDRLADRDRDLMAANLSLQNNAQTQTLINTLQPTPRPAYITCSPYFSYSGCTSCGNV